MMKLPAPDEPPDLLSIAMELHANRWGSSDSYATWCQPEGTKDEHLKLLKDRLVAWKTGAPFTKRFDDAVKNLLEAAVAEWESA